MRYPSIDEIASYLEIDSNVVAESIRANQVIQSIDEPINQEGKEVTLNDIVSKDTIDMDTLIALKEELNNLSEEERILIVGCILENKNQEDIAKKLGISQVQVSRKLNKVKQKIKNNLVTI